MFIHLLLLKGRVRIGSVGGSMERGSVGYNNPRIERTVCITHIYVRLDVCWETGGGCRGNMCLPTKDMVPKTETNVKHHLPLVKLGPPLCGTVGGIGGVGFRLDPSRPIE